MKTNIRKAEHHWIYNGIFCTIANYFTMHTCNILYVSTQIQYSRRNVKNIYSKEKLFLYQYHITVVWEDFEKNTTFNEGKLIMVFCCIDYYY